MYSGNGEDGQDLTSEECVRAGMYWFGRSDFTAADAWWRRALELDPTNTRAHECLRLLTKANQPLPNINISDDLRFEADPSSDDVGVLIPGDDGEPSGPMDVPSWGSPAMVLQSTGDLLDEQQSGPESSRDLPPVSDKPHGNAFPFYDDPSPPAPPTTDAFDFAATGQQGDPAPPMRTPNRGQSPPKSPWDHGPSRTSVVTLDTGSGDYDAVPTPTPLPAIDRERFFGREDPETPKEIMDYLRATGDLPEDQGPVPADDDLSIKIDDPVEVGDPQALSEAKTVHGLTVETPAKMLSEGRRRYQLHDFAGALEVLEPLPQEAPESSEARNIIASARQQMLRNYELKIGDFNRVPRVLISDEQVIWLNLNHRAGFILSQIDGSVSYEDIISLSGMPRLDTVQILSELLRDRVIGVE